MTEFIYGWGISAIPQGLILSFISTIYPSTILYALRNCIEWTALMDSLVPKLLFGQDSKSESSRTEGERKDLFLHILPVILPQTGCILSLKKLSCFQVALLQGTICVSVPVSLSFWAQVGAPPAFYQFRWGNMDADLLLLCSEYCTPLGCFLTPFKIHSWNPPQITNLRLHYFGATTCLQ
jgi:hypothetical protein